MTYQTAHESNRAIWENVATRNCVLDLWLMTEPSEIQPILQSTLNNVNNVKIFDLLAFVVMFLFSSICSHLKLVCGGGLHS